MFVSLCLLFLVFLCMFTGCVFFLNCFYYCGTLDALFQVKMLCSFVFGVLFVLAPFLLCCSLWLLIFVVVVVLFGFCCFFSCCVSLLLFFVVVLCFLVCVCLFFCVSFVRCLCFVWFRFVAELRMQLAK